MDNIGLELCVDNIGLELCVDNIGLELGTTEETLEGIMQDRLIFIDGIFERQH